MADYGNRIPSLTFELIADSAPPRVAAVISDIAGGVIEDSSEAAMLVGFAALGNDRRSAVEPLVELWGGIYHDDGVKLRASATGGTPLAMGEPRRAGCIVEGDRPAPRIEREQAAIACPNWYAESGAVNSPFRVMLAAKPLCCSIHRASCGSGWIAR